MTEKEKAIAKKEDIEKLTGAYVLSHPVRAAIIRLIRKQGQMYTAKIAIALGISERLAAFHLSMLASEGFLESNYRLTNPGIPPRVAKYYQLTAKVDETLREFYESLK